MSETALAICVPLKNEAVLLPDLLGALAAQAGPCGRFTVCLFLDGCTDESSAVAAACAPNLPYDVRTHALPPEAEPNAGRARRLAMDLGLAALPGSGGVLLTSDADTVPAPDWIATTLRALEVADVVTGKVVRDGSGKPEQDALEIYYDRLFALRRTLDPVPWEAATTHHYTAGASMAFRASAYRALGGFEDRAAGEDAYIIDVAQRLGLRVRRDAAVRVETSSRLVGRAVGGLADHLRSLATVGAQGIHVAHPADMVWQYAGHASARARFGAVERPEVVAALATELGVSERHVRETAADSLNAEAFAMRVVPAAPQAGGAVPLAQAEALLDQFAQDQDEAA